MATESVATVTNARIDAARELFNEHPGDVVGMVQIASEKLYELSGLFKAIGLAADGNTMIERLAGIGEYVAEDAGNLLDERQEHYGRALIGSREA